MTVPDRREFFASAVFAAGATGMPAWLAKWFTPQDPAKQEPEDTGKRAKEREAQLRAAVQRAKDEGKPLLVFVVPRDPSGEEARERGEWFGAFLNHGGKPIVHEVVKCVPACGSVDDVRKVTGAGPIEGSPWMLVVDASQVFRAEAPPPRVTPLVLDLGSPRGGGGGRRGADEASRDEAKKRVQDGIWKLYSALRAMLERHGASTEKLIADARATMSAAQQAEIAAWIAGAGAMPTDELMLRAGAEVGDAMAKLLPGCVGDASSFSDYHEHIRLRDALLAAADRELVKKRIPGSRWASSEGCGTTIERMLGETEPLSGIECGMGSVPPQCDRFLEFYTQR